MAEALLPGETLILKVHRHWIVLVKPLLLPLALVVLMAAVDVFARNRVGQDIWVLATLAVIAAAGLWLIVAWLQWTSRSFTLTNQRVILNAGVIAHSTKVIALDRVQDVSTRQNVVGRIFDYGSVEIDAAGVSGAQLIDHLPHPNGFRDQVFLHAEELRRPQPGQIAART